MAIIGKEIGDNIYVHITAVGSLCFEAQQLVRRALDLIPHEVAQGPNVAKVSRRGQRVSLLEYADFEDEPFPLLKSSWSMATASASTLSYRSYERSANPPILHRKELLVSSDHPRYSEWVKTTETCETLGLFDESKTIGFLLNWERAISEKGFRLAGSEFFPLGNDESSDGVNASSSSDLPAIQRHLTAMARTSLSAPVQMLLRHGLLNKEELFFDYGCGRGDDLNSLAANGYRAVGWDPHYAPTTNLPDKAHAVNLGFVINVIEDPAERVEAIARAFKLTSGVLSVGVMLHGVERGGKAYGDGVLTSRGTFQKYFSQAELKDYLEQVLHQESFLVAPGIAFVFADKGREQHFLAAKYRSSNVDRGLILQSRRLVARRETKRVPRTSVNKSRLEAARPILDVYWEAALAIGRYPDIRELPEAMKFNEAVPTFRRLKRLIQAHYPSEILEKARQARSDDLRLYFAVQQFSKRPRYRQLESRLQRDIFEFFGDYISAHSAGLQLLRDASDPDKIHLACMQAAEFGLGEFVAGHSLQLHVELVDRLPVLLRAYIACAMVLTQGLNEAKLVKIHITSGKLSLMEFEDFDANALPLMTRRIKVNLRKLTYDLFDYGQEFPKPILYWKSRYLNEDSPYFAEQLAFDEALGATGVLSNERYGPRPEELTQLLEQARLMVNGWELVPCNTIPKLDSPCGRNFIFRDFVECGETQFRLGCPNIPKMPETYNALYGLATQLLDPLIDYFGAIKLTYGFCSHELGQHIKERVAPTLDQHAGGERKPNGNLICSRSGVACDFLVEDEDMREVATWVTKNLPFDRLYFYGSDRPIHVSWSREPSFKAYEMHLANSGRRLPRPFK
jgi:DNA phosphorothioation-associated putative methyltransferase